MKHFLDLASWPTDELLHILNLAEHLKREWQSGGNRPVLQGRLLGMIFQKPSLRTRVSFHAAMKHLGGDAVTLGPQDIGLGKRESVADIARVLSSYVDVIMARVFDHNDVVTLAENSTVPVINGLSDDYHPCQGMADMLTIKERFGRLRGLKLAYVGDGNNVAASLLYAAIHFGMNFAIATPEGYELPPHIRDTAAALPGFGAVQIDMDTRPERAVDGADILYTDTWTSMGQEDEYEERRNAFAPYQVNSDLLQRADRQAIVMHCLPAHRGDEITDAVADGAQSAIFQQAENRLHAQKAILVHLLVNR